MATVKSGDGPQQWILTNAGIGKVVLCDSAGSPSTFTITADTTLFARESGNLASIVAQNVCIISLLTAQLVESRIANDILAALANQGHDPTAMRLDPAYAPPGVDPLVQ